MNARVLLPGIVIESLGILVIAAGLLAGSAAFIVMGAALIVLSVAVHAVRILRHVQAGRGDPGPGAPGQPGPIPGENVLYADGLVTLTGESITFHHYSFPFFTAGRTVLYQDIGHIAIRKPTVLTGRWRIAGCGDLRTWFPFDGNRPSRDRIFHAAIRTRGMDVGFTVTDPAAVTAILREKGVPVTDDTGAGQ
jgi:hypothetical protein